MIAKKTQKNCLFNVTINMQSGWEYTYMYLAVRVSALNGFAYMVNAIRSACSSLVTYVYDMEIVICITGASKLFT